MKKILVCALIMVIFISGCTTLDPNVQTYKIPYKNTIMNSEGRIKTVQEEMTLELHSDGKACTYKGSSLMRSDQKCGVYQINNGMDLYINISGSIQNEQPWVIEGDTIVGTPLELMTYSMEK
jgi:hypothetical protein